MNSKVGRKFEKLNHYTEVESLKNQIVEKYKPQIIYLFGSCARRMVRKNSDIDLCVVMDYTDKKELLMDMNMSIESDIPIDIILYSVDAWNRYAAESGSFANKIVKEGCLIYG
jgi:uncharacterized protein